MACTSSNMRCKVEAIVNSRIGSAILPLRIITPDAPVEKSPEMGFTPECKPCTLWISTPSSMPAMSSSCDFVPGVSCNAMQPTPPPTALPVLFVSARRAEYEECTYICNTPSLMSTLRRAARPSLSISVAVYARESVGSSVRVISGLATSSPRRPANKLRPFTTLSPFKVEPMIPKNCDVTMGSSTTVVRLLGGFTAPNKRVARSAAFFAAFGRSNSPGFLPNA